jgi:hypothetical protein
MLAIIEGFCRKCAMHGKITGSFEGKMIKIAPSPICRKNKLGMIGEVELYEFSI